MEGRLRTAGFLAGIFVTVTLLIASGICDESLLSIVIAVSLVMAGIEVISMWDAFNRRQSTSPEPAASTSEFHSVQSTPSSAASSLSSNFDPTIPRIEFILTFGTAIWLIIDPLPAAEVLFILLVTWGTDIAAFFGGKIARHFHIAHSATRGVVDISPNKTLEGYIFGTIGGIALAVALLKVVPQLPPFYLFAGLSSDPACLCFTVIGCVLAFAGDLYGSATKRTFGEKDSNTYAKDLPIFGVLEYPLLGHGGYLDRFDSVCLCLAAYRVIEALFYLLQQ